MTEAPCTQSIALLTRKGVELQSVHQRLTSAGFVCEVVEGATPDGVRQPQIEGGFLGGGDRIVVDVLPFPWPEPLTSPSAWGPYTTAEGLKWACLHSPGWEEAADVVASHDGLICLRYFEGDTPAQTGSEQVRRLLALVKLALALSSLPEVAAYYCPGGEVLLPLEFVGDVVQSAQMVGMPPFDLLANLRLSWLDERWVIFETVGNQQIGLADIEVYADSQGKDLNELASWIRRWSWQHFLPEHALVDGTTIEGPGGAMFQVVFAEDALLLPYRSVVRLVCQDATPMPTGLPKRLRIDHA